MNCTTHESNSHSPNSHPSVKSRWPRRLFVLVLILHTLLLGYGAWIHSPTWDEIGHMGAGMIHWKTGNFEAYRVNPPLVRCLATLPVFLTGADSPGLTLSQDPRSRQEFSSGAEFIQKNGRRSFWYFTMARWMVIPFSLLGALICFRWASELFGPWSGLFAGSLWSFCPSILGYGQYITPDVAAASSGVLFFYLFWHWLKEPQWGKAFWSGAAMALALLVKLTWIVLFALAPLVWMIWEWFRRGEPSAKISGRKKIVQFAGMMMTGVYLLNLGYLFEGVLIPLETYTFVSATMSGHTDETGQPQKGNRFSGTWMGKLPVIVPANFLRGLDLQRSDFERPRWSYLAGQWRKHGWWYYYLYAFGVKLPLGTLLLMAVSIVAGCFGIYRKKAKADLFVLLVPAILLFVFISSQTGLSRHHRYALVVLPFFFIAISGLVGSQAERRLGWKFVAWGLLAWSMIASLWYYPHSMSYFNILVGGPKNGAKHLIDSNIDWGQDMLLLKRWYDKHPEARPFGVAPKLPIWLIDPESFGMELIEFPVMEEHPEVAPPSSPEAMPRPGWYAVSVCGLYSRRPDVQYFRKHLEPVDRIGYSMYIYHVTADDVARLRRIWGVSPANREAADDSDNEVTP